MTCTLRARGCPLLWRHIKIEGSIVKTCRRDIVIAHVEATCSVIQIGSLTHKCGEVVAAYVFCVSNGILQIPVKPIIHSPAKSCLCAVLGTICADVIDWPERF